MQISDFAIGQDFLTVTGRWRCTDIGTRTITAVRWPDPEFEADEARHSTLWLQGPPYMVPETVFDEKEMARAYRTSDEAVAQALHEHQSSFHPGFDSKHIGRLFHKPRLSSREEVWADRYRKPLLRHDRVRDGRVLHAYSWSNEGEEAVVLVFDLFSQDWLAVPLLAWLRLPLATEADLQAATEAQRGNGP